MGLPILLVLALLLWPGAGVRADPASALVTIAEGQAHLIRGVTRAPLALGNRIRAGDIVQVEGAGFFRVETADGLRLDLGPGTRALWLPPKLGTRAGARLIYLASGWVKVSTPAQRGATPIGVATPDLDLDDYGIVVLGQGAGKVNVFAETGPLKGTERLGAIASPVVLKAGEFLARSGERKAAVLPRPTPEFISGLIRPFMDAIPPRHAEIAKREVALRPGAPVVYEDIQTWLRAEAPLRQALVPRWRPLVSDAAFRAAITSNMRLHPEWDPILNPEQYRSGESAQSAAGKTERP